MYGGDYVGETGEDDPWQGPVASRTRSVIRFSRVGGAVEWRYRIIYYLLGYFGEDFRLSCLCLIVLCISSIPMNGKFGSKPSFCAYPFKCVFKFRTKDWIVQKKCRVEGYI